MSLWTNIVPLVPRRNQPRRDNDAMEAALQALGAEILHEPVPAALARLVAAASPPPAAPAHPRPAARARWEPVEPADV